MKHTTLSFSEDQLLEMYLLNIGIGAITPSGLMLRADGIDLDEQFRLKLRCRYAELLASGNPELLPVSDIAHTLNLAMTIDPETLVATIDLPDNVIRPVQLQLSSWKMPLAHFFVPSHPVALMQSQKYTRAGTNAPVGVVTLSHITLYSAANLTDSLLMAQMVVRPPQGSYSFAEAALPFMLRD